MRIQKKDKSYLLEFLMKSNSLHDLLGILSNICKNLDLVYLNPKIKHFRYFQFTFFGLLVKAKGLLEMMTFRAEFLRNNIDEFEDIYTRLLRLKKKMDASYKAVNECKMREAEKKIIDLEKEYNLIFEEVRKMCIRIV